MPLPDERDVLGCDAGPAKQRPEPQASSMNPLRLFQRDGHPFPIQRMAATSTYEHTKPAFGHPSPPASQSSSVDNDEDAMDIDWSQPGPTSSQIAWPASQSQIRNQARTSYLINPTQQRGWSGVRNETFQIQNSLRSENERRRREAETAHRHQPRQYALTDKSPFRGALPPAPMSMERRLRNPPTGRTEPRDGGPTAQSNFMSNMAQGIEEASSFRSPQGQRRNKVRNGAHRPDPDLDGSQYDPDEISESTHTESNADGFEIRPGRWTLQQDLDAQATGLEDLFGGNAFRIADEPGNRDVNGSIIAGKNSKISGWKYLTLAVAVAFFSMLWLWLPVRRAVAFYLLERLDRLEHWLFVDPDVVPFDHA